MRTLIVTVAGTATRFNSDTKVPTLKCLYHTSSIVNSLLFQILKKSENIERCIIVGGYLYEELKNTIDNAFGHYRDKITLVFNEKYEEYGSGYSLIKGIEALNGDAKEVIFVEGDLFFDSDSYDKVINSPKDVLTVNSEPITADKSVAFYINDSGKLKYIYDLKHNAFKINEPFLSIHNSAQIWKFRDCNELKSIPSQLSAEQIRGTNLEIIQTYFKGRNINNLDIIKITEWINCNTVDDYLKAFNN
jgi:CTP:phosphocholine cytidylyltransferase-like protein